METNLFDLDIRVISTKQELSKPDPNWDTTNPVFSDAVCASVTNCSIPC